MEVLGWFLVPLMEHTYGEGDFDYKHHKVDMSLFDGTNPNGWIVQAERYFAIYKLINEEQVEADILSLSRDALSWFRWSNKQKTIDT